MGNVANLRWVIAGFIALTAFSRWALVAYARTKYTGIKFFDPFFLILAVLMGGLAAAITTIFASDYAQVELVGVSEKQIQRNDPENGQISTWMAKTYNYRILYEPGDRQSLTIERVPFTATAPRTQILLDSTLPITKMEWRGRIASWNNIAPGALGLIFDSYRRVINETVDLSTGDRLFFKWMGNSFQIAVGRVILMPYYLLWRAMRWHD